MPDISFMQYHADTGDWTPVHGELSPIILDFVPAKGDYVTIGLGGETPLFLVLAVFYDTRPTFGIEIFVERVASRLDLYSKLAHNPRGA